MLTRKMGQQTHIGDMPEPASEMIIFDRTQVRRQRDRAAVNLGGHDFLLREVAGRLVERLQDVRRSFSVALDLGCHTGQTGAAIHGVRGVETVIQADFSTEMAKRVDSRAAAVDEERLPFAPGSFDLVVSNLSLHWVNDLPGALIQIRQSLKPDGLFLAALLGGDTLFELRQAFMEAELELTGGISPRVSPMAELRDGGSLMQRAGFALPVVDGESFTVTYADPFALMAELRGMGETNAVLARPKTPLSRTLLAETARRYAELFGEPDGRVRATFQVIYLTGWAPHDAQQKPLRPGAAKSRLADALDATEMPAGDPARPH
jgi:SAM-dependent methyltransferase